ncbi:hypothetical protein ACFV27_42140 [Streptomyces antimycoticus]|uniref:hypothetical protein n=2 Tax=Streptomyces antimycoticus TaxID=68175 RepID=UPI0036B6E4D2
MHLAREIGAQLAGPVQMSGQPHDADAVAPPAVREAVRTHPWARARQRLHDDLGPAGWAGRWALSAAPLWRW